MNTISGVPVSKKKPFIILNFEDFFLELHGLLRKVSVSERNDGHAAET